MPNEIQRFDITGSPGSGNFTLWFNGEGTSPIDYHPAAGDVQDELEALTTIGPGNITVTKDGNWGYICTFAGALTSTNLPELVADDSQLPGGATITVTTVTQGGPDTETPGTGATLTTPCTLPHLLAFATDILPVTSGSHHDAIVTTTADTITVAWA